jgi:cobalt-zinc-cadmium efflux system membrane fusion protein
VLVAGGASTRRAAAVQPYGKITVPEGSSLRQQPTVMPAAAQAVEGKLVLPGVVESDPARTAVVLTPLGGRVRELKVALGDRVSAGQVVAVIDSPDLAQAYDDDDKAAEMRISFSATRAAPSWWRLISWPTPGMRIR